MIFLKSIPKRITYWQTHLLHTTNSFNFRSTQSLCAPATQDYYKLLGVPRDSSAEEIKKAYYKLVHICHPDKNPNDIEAAKQKLAEINAAYDTLKDENKRRNYDMTGVGGNDQAQGNPYAGAWSGTGNNYQSDEMFSDFDSFFNMGSANGAAGRVQKGVDIFSTIDLTFIESVNGINKKITFDKKGVCQTCSGAKCKPGTNPIKCNSCAGTGQISQRQGPMTIQMQCPKCAGQGTIIKHPCTTCRGSGVSKAKVEEEVEIPKGVNHGQNLRLPRKGHSSDQSGGVPGDLIVKVNVKPDAYFKRDNCDIVTSSFITLAEAALGTKIKVKTLLGEKEIEVKAGTAHGEKVVMKGFGVAHLPPNQNEAGDHVVTLKVHVPKNLTARQLELYRLLSEVEVKVDPIQNTAECGNSHAKQNHTQQKSNNDNNSSNSNNKNDNSSSSNNNNGNVYSKLKKMWGGSE